MTLLMRALLYITRKRRRTLILFAIVFIMSALSVSALAVCQSAINAAEEYERTLGASFDVSVFYSPDDELWETIETESGTERQYIGPPIDREMISRIMSVPGVVSTFPTEK